MKSSFLKKAFLPLAVIMIAVLSAFGTKTPTLAEKGTATAVQGWIYTGGHCVESIMCSETGGPLCKTASNVQVFDKDAPDSCPIELHRLNR